MKIGYAHIGRILRCRDSFSFAPRFLNRLSSFRSCCYFMSLQDLGSNIFQTIPIRHVPLSTNKGFDLRCAPFVLTTHGTSRVGNVSS